MPKKATYTSGKTALRGDHFLSPLVALIVHGESRVSLHLKEVLENVACDWRVLLARDGAEAARHVMNKGVPDLLIVGAGLARVTGADLADWIRSFRRDYPVTILFYGEPQNEEEREQLLRNEAKMILPEDLSEDVLAPRLAQIVARSEKFRLAPLPGS